jgi:hypothetical protein
VTFASQVIPIKNVGSKRFYSAKPTSFTVHHPNTFVQCLDGDALTFIPKYMVTVQLCTHGLVQESSGFGSKQKGNHGTSQIKVYKMKLPNAMAIDVIIFHTPRC